MKKKTPSRSRPLLVTIERVLDLQHVTGGNGKPPPQDGGGATTGKCQKSVAPA